MNIALVGNQNSGKTTLFNYLTGMNQKVGNFPGITVDIKEGYIKNTEFKIIDLPGVYSLYPYSPEEKYTFDYLKNQNVDIIFNLIDVSTIKRGFYLTLQLCEIKKPMIIAFSMIKEINSDLLQSYKKVVENELKVPVLLFNPREKNLNKEIINILNNHMNINIYHDTYLINKKIKIDYKNIFDYFEEIHLKNKINYEETIYSKYDYIDQVLVEEKEYKRNKIDIVLTNRYFGIPIFTLVFICIFFVCFGVISNISSLFIKNYFNQLITIIIEFLNDNNINTLVINLIKSILQSLSIIINFIPLMTVLYFFLSYIQDTGYMARVAFLFDGLLRKIGLSGKSIVPILLGFGCSGGGMIGSRIIENEDVRKKTQIIIPFIPCSAKIAILGLLLACIEPRYRGIVGILIYCLSITLGFVFCGFVSRKKVNNNFLLELPPYRFPSVKNSLKDVATKTKEIIKKISAMVIISSIIIFFLNNFNCKFQLIEDFNNDSSIIKVIATFIFPMFKVIGFCSWQQVASLFFGVLSKETIVSSLNVLSSGNYQVVFVNHVSAFCYVLFCFLYMPCLPTISILNKENNSKKKNFIILTLQNVFAYIITFLVYQISILL